MILDGTIVSAGMASGRAAVLDARFTLHAVSDPGPHDHGRELERLHAALSRACVQLDRVKRQLVPRLPDADLAIFDTHVGILRDPKFVDEIEREIRSRGVVAEVAAAEVVQRIHAKFTASTTPTIQDKAADILDIGRRILRCLNWRPAEREHADYAIVVAASITPSELVSMAHSGVAGFVVEHCGPNSHSAILARGLGLPVVGDVRDACSRIPQDSIVLVDGVGGRIVVRPSDAERSAFESQQERYAATRPGVRKPVPRPITRDGTRIDVLLNISDPLEVGAVSDLNAAGIGLFRTEFLYMDRDNWPTEDDSYRVYRRVASAIGDRELHIRLADFGAEKCPAYADLPTNRNPSLGLRGLRLLLQREDILRPQVRALARLAAARPLTVLLPMVDTADTLDAAIRTLCGIAGCSNRVDLPFKLGAMVELPSAAVVIEDLIESVDSFAIGLNDLTQYTLAADRDDELVEPYHDATQPAVIRLVAQVVRCADAHRKPVTMCGELAGDPALTGLLLALGLRRLSVAGSSFCRVAEAVSQLSVPELATLSERLLALRSGSDVRRFAAEALTHHC